MLRNPITYTLLLTFACGGGNAFTSTPDDGLKPSVELTTGGSDSMSTGGQGSETGGSSGMATGGHSSASTGGSSSASTGGAVSTGGSASTGSSSSTSTGGSSAASTGGTIQVLTCSATCVAAEGKCWQTCETNSVSVTGTLNSPTNCESSCSTQEEDCVVNCEATPTQNNCIMPCGITVGTCWAKCFTDNYGTINGPLATTQCQQACNNGYECTAACMQ